MAMEPTSHPQLERSASLTSRNSRSSSRKSQTVRVRIRKHDSNTSLQPAPTPLDESFTSFPSLSPPPDSPIAARSHIAERARLETNDAAAPGDSDSTDTSTVRRVSRTAQSLVGSLVESSSPDVRNALFDDAPRDTRAVPGNLHHAPDVHIEHIIDQTGAVALIKQLAGDLASRDAQITALRLRAQERERLLRKMLNECEVSNLDIESRLRALDQAADVGNDIKKSKSSKRASILADTYMHDTIDKRLQSAMQEEVTDYAETLSYQDSTVEGNNTAEQTSDALSGTTAASKDARTWKSYIWSDQYKTDSKASSIISDQGDGTDNDTRARAESNSRPSRALRSDLFVPPDQGAGAVPNLRRLQSQDRGNKSRKSSGGVASWALRLVSGGGTVNASTLRGKNDVSEQATVTQGVQYNAGGSKTLPRQQVGPVTRGRATRTSLGPNGTVKGVSPESVRTNLATTSPHGGLRRTPSNAGPVEMDTILPEDTRPPTLAQLHSYVGSQEYLTDRFGFIYDQRRKKRQSEAAAALRKQKRVSNVESLGSARDTIQDMSDHEQSPTPVNNRLSRVSSRPGSNHSSVDETQTGKRWQDFLKLATFPTELLSHTPSTGPITAVESVEIEVTPKNSQVTVQKGGSMPASSANPAPSPSRVSAGNAEFAAPILSTEPASPIAAIAAVPQPNQPDPVKALLEQLTELHDSTQREKTVKWNEFLRKVRAERKREGESVAASSDGRSNMPEALLMDGEVIGIASLGNKGNIGRAKWKEFRDHVLGGIPVAYRAKIWAECSGAAELRHPGYYEDLLSNGIDDPVIVGQIEMDITRTLTDNIFFRRGPGVQKLKEVLVAYSRRNTTVGYCQGMNLITASLLLIMPSAEDAFWVLASMIENILPENYYDHSLLTSRADQVVLRSYVSELLPKLSAHLDELSIELEALTFQWFLSVFTDCLTAEALFRVWDVLLCMHDGSTFLFQVALALLKLNERSLLDCDNPASIYHYINHQMTNHAISIDGLINASEALKKVVKRKDVEERRAKAVEREKEIMQQREELRKARAENKGTKAATSSTSMSKTPDTQQQSSATIEKSSNGTTKPRRDVSRPSPTVLKDPESGTSSRIITPLFSPLRSASSVASFNIDADEFAAELEARTPMPIDEEAEWRA